MGIYPECFIKTINGLIYYSGMGIFVRTIDRWAKVYETGGGMQCFLIENTAESKRKGIWFSPVPWTHWER